MEDEVGFTKYIKVTMDSYRSSYTIWSNGILSRTFLGLSEQMLLVAFWAKFFPFGSTEIQMRC